MPTHPTARDKLNGLYALAALAAGVLAGAVTESFLVFLLATVGALIAFASAGRHSGGNRDLCTMCARSGASVRRRTDTRGRRE